LVTTLWKSLQNLPQVANIEDPHVRVFANGFTKYFAERSVIPDETKRPESRSHAEEETRQLEANLRSIMEINPTNKPKKKNYYEYKRRDDDDTFPRNIES